MHALQGLKIARVGGKQRSWRRTGAVWRRGGLADSYAFIQSEAGCRIDPIP